MGDMTARHTLEPAPPLPARSADSQCLPQRAAANDEARYAIDATQAVDAQASRAHWARLQEAGLSAGLWFLYYCHRLFGRALFRARGMSACGPWPATSRPAMNFVG